MLGDFPGTAFTRSFGDGVAEELGVTAEPEVFVRYAEPRSWRDTNKLIMMKILIN